MELTLGFSTCPNDTFIFDAMIHGKVDTEGLRFHVIMADVEKLNRMSFAGETDISKLSYHAYACIADKYKLLNSGSALGFGNGPLLISKKKIYPDEVSSLRVAIPGKYTTANLLFGIEYPQIKEKREYLFSDIEDAILGEETDAGVIIHENRFTYQKKGLKKIVDLGELWEKKTHGPIPLGGIAIQRNFPDEIQEKVDRVMRRSVEFALINPDSSYNFVKHHACEMDDEVIRKHIETYVGEFTRNLGEKGKMAIRRLFDEGVNKHMITPVQKDIFVNYTENF